MGGGVPPVAATPDETAKPPGLDPQEVVKTFKARIETSKTHRRSFSGGWKRNIETRLGEPTAADGSGVYEQDGADRQSVINPDWSLTKTKTANLYSQVPAVQVTHEQRQFAPAIAPFAKALNYELGEKRANIAVPMEEVLNDVVNASGVGAVMVGYAARFETVNLPTLEEHKGLPPELLAQGMQAGVIPSSPVQRVVDYKFFGKRISPGDLLWPKEFVGSNFDDADYVGYTARDPWAVAKADLGLTDEQKDAACGGGEVMSQDDLRTTPDRTGSETDTVTYDVIYYWRYRVDPDEHSFCAIWKLVVVHGLPDFSLHEPWKGQLYDPERRTYIGSHKPPLRFLTLTYVSDHPVPPSDTAAGRPQVDDMRRSRSQMFDQRDRSRPVRWFDVNRVDPTIQDALMRGTWQGFVPTNGDGARSVGEIARASYPSEDLSFDQQTKQDLMESWQIGPNQMGTTASGTTATESNNVQGNFATRIGQERSRVATFFLSIAEVLAGWMCLYSDFPNLSDEERQAMTQAWDQKHILHDVVLKIRPDSAIVLDSQQRATRLTTFLNFAAKSGLIDPAPVIAEIAELSGLDPSSVMKKPEPPPPEEPSISLRLSGKEDLINPLVMALLVKLHKAPSPEELAEAQKILLAAASGPPPPAGPEGIPGQPPSTGGPGAPPALPPGPVAGLLPPAPPVQPGDAHPDWSLNDKIAKRARDGDPGA